MHKHELIFDKLQQFQQQKKLNSLRSMNASCQKFHFYISDR